MEQIDADELKQKLDHGDEFKLVMTLGQLAFRGKHIAGSLEMHDPDTLLNELDPEDEIVVYCSDKLCPASMMAYHLLADRGYKHVRRFSGGLAEWEAAGYPLEGILAQSE